jgi:hypothetical protein
MKLFTLAEAEALLPRVREKMLELQRCRTMLTGLQDLLARSAQKSAGNGHVSETGELAGARQQAETLAAQLNGLLAELLGWGCQVKGLDEGLVDFPSEREGRIVLLCWRLGESRIDWWHEEDAGFAGRQPLDR